MSIFNKPIQQKLRLVLCFVMIIPACLIQAQPETLDEQLLVASPTTITADSQLSAHTTMLAEQAIGEHCAVCHGTNLEGQVGVPNLVDYDWLWGVTGMEVTSAEPVMEIMQTILYGIRDVDCSEEVKRYGACPDTRFSQMPAYGEGAFSDQQIRDLTEYVLNMSGQEADLEAVARAENLWAICTECHGEGGYGYKQYGGPDLTDSVWLFGNTREQIYDVIDSGRTESCPPWAQTLNLTTIKALAVYIYNKSNGY